MKKIHVFIASSAELDEDKTQLDLFFAEKNKIYAERDILFVQKTWKDFESSLHERFLQDRYDAYIRKCDIVLFLFHTKLGKYTLHELEIAKEVFRQSRHHRPRIFIFYKETRQQSPELADFKSFSEQNYGHFCDTYADYAELWNKMEKQLQLLENSGYIVPNHFNPKKATKYVLFYLLLPLLLVGLGFAAFHYYSDMDMTITIQEDPARSIAALPFRQGVLEVQYGEGEKQTFPLDDRHREAFIKGIHAKYKGTDAHIRFEADGYEQVDTTVSIASELVLPIRRNNDLGIIYGSVVDEAGNPLSGVALSTQDLTVESDAAGNFRLEIPLGKQAEEQLLSAFKPGYQRWTFTGPVMPNVPWNIVLKK